METPLSPSPISISPRPRIGVDLHTLEGLHQGSRTHCLELFSRVHKLLPEINFTFLVDTNKWERSNLQLFAAPNSEVVHMQQTGPLARLGIHLPALVRKHGIDLLHTQYVRPLFVNAKTAVTIHDILPEEYPEYFETTFRWRSRALFRMSARRSAIVFTVSDYSRSKLSNLYAVPDSKLVTIFNGVSTERFFPGTEGAMEVRALGLTPGQYLLTVGRLEPRKNHLGLLQAFAALPTPRLKLAIVGQQDFGYKAIFQMVRMLGLQDDVVFLQSVGDDLLMALHRNAKLFVYPTFAEGFGMPVLEAMASGVPVVTSDTTALPEIAKGAAVLVDPHDVASIREGMERVLHQPEMVTALCEKGLERVTHFTWGKSAAILAAAYRSHFLSRIDNHFDLPS